MSQDASVPPNPSDKMPQEASSGSTHSGETLEDTTQSDLNVEEDFGPIWGDLEATVSEQPSHEPTPWEEPSSESEPPSPPPTPPWDPTPFSWRAHPVCNKRYAIIAGKRVSQLTVQRYVDTLCQIRARMKYSNILLDACGLQDMDGQQVQDLLHQAFVMLHAYDKTFPLQDKIWTPSAKIWQRQAMITMQYIIINETLLFMTHTWETGKCAPDCATALPCLWCKIHRLGNYREQRNFFAHEFENATAKAPSAGPQSYSMIATHYQWQIAIIGSVVPELQRVLDDPSAWVRMANAQQGAPTVGAQPQDPQVQPLEHPLQEALNSAYANSESARILCDSITLAIEGARLNWQSTQMTLQVHKQDNQAGAATLMELLTDKKLLGSSQEGEAGQSGNVNGEDEDEAGNEEETAEEKEKRDEAWAAYTSGEAAEVGRKDESGTVDMDVTVDTDETGNKDEEAESKVVYCY